MKVVACATLLASLTAPPVLALDNGLALTPPMGWLSWERYACVVDCEADPDNCISADLYQRMADEMVAGGYLDAGYEYVNIDDCWNAMDRDADGNLYADPVRFPQGIKGVADYVHGLGLKLGLYLDIGEATCGGYPAFNVSTDEDDGPDAQYIKDVNLMAEWGIDSLKVDGCNQDPTWMNITYPKVGRALNATGRPILYSCSWPDYVRLAHEPVQFELMAEYCNIWRNYDDIWDYYDSINNIISYWRQPGDEDVDAFVNVAAPGSQNDPDMILVGGTGLSTAQWKMQMSMWSIFAAPLLMSNDLPNISEEAKEILLNKEVIAINQDPAVKQGRCVKNCDGTSDQQVWSRELADGSLAVALLNTYAFGPPQKITLEPSDVGIPEGTTFKVRDLWTHTDLGDFVESFASMVPSTSVTFIKVAF